MMMLVLAAAPSHISLSTKTSKLNRFIEIGQGAIVGRGDIQEGAVSSWLDDSGKYCEDEDEQSCCGSNGDGCA